MEKALPDNSIVSAAVIDPTILIGKNISPGWNNNDKLEWYDGRIETIAMETKEYELKYANVTSAYLTFDEVITDIRNGDLKIL